MILVYSRTHAGSHRWLTATLITLFKSEEVRKDNNIEDAPKHSYLDTNTNVWLISYFRPISS